MATGRTLSRWSRIYAGGIDISGFSRSFGPLLWEYDEADMTCALGDTAKGYLPNHPSITPTAINVCMSPAAGGAAVFLNLANAAGIARVVLIPIGIRAAPAAGDPCWAGQFRQLDYLVSSGEQAVTANVSFSPWDAAGLTAYHKPWGNMLHVQGSETGANAGTGIDDRGLQTTAGGYFVYQIFSITGSGTVTLSVDDSADNAVFTALSGATSGAIATASAPVAGIVAIGTTATVRRYLRWQLALGGSATACNFASAFVRI